MPAKRIPTVGNKSKDVSNDVERVKADVAKKPTVVSYTAAIGNNTRRHGQTGKPSGRHIVWSEVGNLLDISITSTEWTFSATIAGTVKVIWL